MTVLCLLCAVPACSAHWERFVSPECGFSILMPGTPRTTGANLETSHGTLVFVWYVGTLGANPLRSQLATANPGAGCAVVPEGVDADSILQEFESAVPKERDRVLGHRQVMVGEHAGLEIERESGDVVFIDRAFAHDGKVFWIHSQKEGNALFAGRHLKFLDSFSIAE